MTDYDDSYREWMAYTKDLEMVALQDDGLYRHLRFKSPAGWFFYDLVTWPGHLYVGGSLDAYTFARMPDMFEFFGSGVSGVEPGRINPDYWAEKITAASTPAHCWSPEKFRRAVVEDFMDARHRFPIALPLWRQIREDFLDEDVFGYSVAEEAEDARAALSRFEYSDEHGTFHFEDFWEWDTEEWSVHYLRACHAIVWGIQQYRAASNETSAAA